MLIIIVINSTGTACSVVNIDNLNIFDMFSCIVASQAYIGCICKTGTGSTNCTCNHKC